MGFRPQSSGSSSFLPTRPCKTTAVGDAEVCLCTSRPETWVLLHAKPTSRYNITLAYNVVHSKCSQKPPDNKQVPTCPMRDVQLCMLKLLLHSICCHHAQRNILDITGHTTTAIDNASSHQHAVHHINLTDTAWANSQDPRHGWWRLPKPSW